jgi:hypothetical protein
MRQIDLKSPSGYATMIGGCLFGWFSRKQDIVSFFIAEAEYTAMSECCKEMNGICVFLAEIHQEQSVSIDMHVDNQSAVL